MGHSYALVCQEEGPLKGGEGEKRKGNGAQATQAQQSWAERN